MSICTNDVYSSSGSFLPHLGLQDTPSGHDGEFVLVDEAGVHRVFGDAADAVAAHLRLGAVGIDDPHGYVRALSRQDIEDAVRTDAEMTVADLLAPCRIHRDRVGDAVEDDEVVPDPMVLPELHLTAASSERSDVSTVHPPVLFRG